MGSYKIILLPEKPMDLNGMFFLQLSSMCPFLGFFENGIL